MAVKKFFLPVLEDKENNLDNFDKDMQKEKDNSRSL